MATEKTKTEATPKRVITSKDNPERPLKPEFVVIEDNLHYSPDGVREIVATIDPEWGLIEPILSGADDDEMQAELVKKILGVVYGDEATAQLFRGLKTSQFFKFVYRWMDEFTKNMGISTPGE